MSIYRNEETVNELLIYYNQINKKENNLVNDSLARRLLNKTLQVTSPIAIDKFFGIEVAHGISISFAARSTTFLFEVMSDELSSGYLAVSNAGDIGIIQTDKTNNKSSVILIGKHNDVFEFFLTLWYFWAYNDDKADLRKPPEITLEEINSIFYARTGHECLIKLFHKMYNCELRSKEFMINTYNKELAVTLITHYIIHNDSLEFSNLKNITLNEETIKHIHLIKTVFKLMLHNSIYKNLKTKDAICDCLIIKSRRGFRGGQPCLMVASKLVDFDSADLCKKIRHMKIVNFAAHIIKKAGMTDAHILQFESGDCFVYRNNLLIGKFPKDKPMDVLGGIINDDYAFQLLEMLYVGQTTIIE